MQEEIKQIAEIIGQLGAHGVRAFVLWLGYRLITDVMGYAVTITVVVLIFNRVKAAILGAFQAVRDAK